MTIQDLYTLKEMINKLIDAEIIKLSRDMHDEIVHIERELLSHAETLKKDLLIKEEYLIELRGKRYKGLISACDVENIQQQINALLSKTHGKRKIDYIKE